MMLFACLMQKEKTGSPLFFAPMIRLLFLLSLVLLSQTTIGQRDVQAPQGRQMQPVQLSGKISSHADGQSLPGAHIQLQHLRDTTRKFNATTDNEGIFALSVPRGRYLLSASYIGYRKLQEEIRVFEDKTDLGVLKLFSADAQLDEVTVVGEAVPVRLKGDTLQFDAQAFKTNPDASAEDLVRKLPGVTIDTEGVKAQGEQVQRVLVDGQEFFGDDPNIALRNLPAEMISQVEVFDQLSEQSQLTGFDDGERIKTINIVTRLDRRSGQFGRVYAGYGENGRYQAGIVTNLFMDKRRISIIGMSNNINQQNFSSEDLSGFMSSSSRRGGGMSRMGGGRPPGGSFNRGDFLVGQQNGNNSTNSFGINLTDELFGKLNINASYFFNHLGNETEQFADRQYFINENTTQLYQEENSSERQNQNHRFNARIEYRINEKHSLMIIPRFSFQQTNSESYSEAALWLLGDQLLNNSLTGYNRDWNGFNFSNTLIYRARLNERGRSISTRINTNINNNEFLYFLDAISITDAPIPVQDLIDQQSSSTTNSWSASSNVTFNEPIGEKSQLQLSYNLSYSDNTTERLTNSWDILQQSYSILEDELSSELTSGYLTNRLGLGYRFRAEKFNFLAQLSYQNASLQADQVLPYPALVNYAFDNIIPMLQFNYNFSRSNSLRLMYRSFTNAPSVNQLQDVVDNANPLLVSSGNPDLKQSYSHFITGRYNLTKVAESRSVFIFAMASFTADYIGNTTLITANDTVLANGYRLPPGAQYSRPENMDGFVNLRSSFNYGFPVTFLKSNMNLSAGLAYSRLPSMINGQENMAQSYTSNAGLSLSSNISPNVDFTLGYRLNYQTVENSLRPNLDNNFFFHIAEARFNWIFLENWVLRNDVSNLFYTGMGEDFNENYWLWNINFGRKFLANKRGELMIGVYDLLDQNKSVSRNVTDTYIEDTRFNVLSRFVMLTFTYNFRNFVRRNTAEI